MSATQEIEPKRNEFGWKLDRIRVVNVLDVIVGIGCIVFILLILRRPEKSASDFETLYSITVSLAILLLTRLFLKFVEPRTPTPHSELSREAERDPNRS